MQCAHGRHQPDRAAAAVRAQCRAQTRHRANDHHGVVGSAFVVVNAAAFRVLRSLQRTRNRRCRIRDPWSRARRTLSRCPAVACQPRPAARLAPTSASNSSDQLGCPLAPPPRGASATVPVSPRATGPVNADGPLRAQFSSAALANGTSTSRSRPAVDISSAAALSTVTRKFGGNRRRGVVRGAIGIVDPYRTQPQRRRPTTRRWPGQPCRRSGDRGPHTGEVGALPGDRHQRMHAESLTGPRARRARRRRSSGRPTDRARSVARQRRWRRPARRAARPLARTAIATAVRPGRRHTGRPQCGDDRRSQPAGPDDRQRLRERGRVQR